VKTALSAATQGQGDGEPLHLDDHVDGKGNTLLHVINDAQLISFILAHCDSDVNAANDKKFTPLMVASKYGRTDLVRTFFSDPRVDINARELRGLTAVELAKDDEVRNRIDDLVLMSNSSILHDRVTRIVRSFFVEDGSIRLVLKSAARNDDTSVTITTCRRSLLDFENLDHWLALEHPASWLPALKTYYSPYLIPTKPSRAVLRDIQVQLDHFLRTLLSHATFSTHEMVWEFFLVPEIDAAMLTERTRKKAEARVENIREEFTAITEVSDVELFVSHARDSIRVLHHSTKTVIRRLNKLRWGYLDYSDATTLSSTAVSTLTFVPTSHLVAFESFTKTFACTESEPLTKFYYDMQGISSTINAVLNALGRPIALIGSMSAIQKAIDRHKLSLKRSDRWPLGLLDETRQKLQRDAVEKAHKTEVELENLGKELRYTQQVVAGEMAAWQESRVSAGRAALRELAKRMVVHEKVRLEGMTRALRKIHASSVGNGTKSKTASTYIRRKPEPLKNQDG
jgi:hypothetical protein